MPLEHTAEELNSLLGTMSFWSRLSRVQRTALQSENRALYERIGRPIRSSTLACLVTARRASPGSGPQACAQTVPISVAGGSS